MLGITQYHCTKLKYIYIYIYMLQPTNMHSFCLLFFLCYFMIIAARNYSHLSFFFSSIILEIVRTTVHASLSTPLPRKKKK